MDRHALAHRVRSETNPQLDGSAYSDTAMSAALKVLGYNDVYHMSSCISNPPDSVVWRRAVRAKWFGQGKVFARENWDLLLGDCMVRGAI